MFSFLHDTWTMMMTTTGGTVIVIVLPSAHDDDDVGYSRSSRTMIDHRSSIKRSTKGPFTHRKILDSSNISFRLCSDTVYSS